MSLSIVRGRWVFFLFSLFFFFPFLLYHEKLHGLGFVRKMQKLWTQTCRSMPPQESTLFSQPQRRMQRSQSIPPHMKYFFKVFFLAPISCLYTRDPDGVHARPPWQLRPPSQYIAYTVAVTLERWGVVWRRNGQS